jgi:hypothetical protein
MTRAPQDPPEPAAGRWLRNTAEPSGELSVGDVVAVGEAGLAVGWTLVRGGLNEVRTAEHGTRPPAGVRPSLGHRRPHGHLLPRSRSDLMPVRKPNRVTTPKRAVLNGTKASHASMPRARDRWRPDVTRNRASAPGRRRMAWPPEDDTPQEAA